MHQMPSLLISVGFKAFQLQNTKHFGFKDEPLEFFCLSVGSVCVCFLPFHKAEELLQL